MATNISPFLGMTFVSGASNSVTANVSLGICIPFHRAIFSQTPNSRVTIQIDSLVSEREVKVYRLATGYTEKMGKTFKKSISFNLGLGDNMGSAVLSLGAQGEYPCPVQLSWNHTFQN